MRPKFTPKKSWGRKMSLLAGVAMLSISQLNAQTYCTPAYLYACSSSDDINTITLTAANGTSINQPTTGCTTSGYIYYSTLPTISVITGNTYSGTINSEYSSNENVSIWIDFNNNGTFETTEQIGTVANFGTSITNYTITIPATAQTGSNLRMRYRNAYYTPPATMDPCTSYTYGETHDYNVNVLPPAPPNNAGVGTLVTPDTTPKCSNTMQSVSVSVINLGSNALTSANLNWSLNGVLQTPMPLTLSLPNFKDSTIVVLGNVFFPTTAPIQLKAWTDSPNGVTDAIPADDTLNKPMSVSLQGVDVNITPGDTIICSGSTITLDAGSDHPTNPIYVWNTSQLTSSIQVSQAGTYSVWVQNSDGCVDRDTVTVAVHPDPVVNSIAIIDNGNGEYTFNVIGAQNITSYTWNFGDLITHDGVNLPTQIIHQYDTAGNYTVILTLRNDCGEITVTRVISTTGAAPTDVGNVKGLDKAISMAPNPSKSVVTINSGSAIKMNAVNVYNLVGQKVFGNDKVDAAKYEFNVSGIAAGIYNVIIETSEGKITKKLEVIQ